MTEIVCESEIFHFSFFAFNCLSANDESDRGTEEDEK